MAARDGASSVQGVALKVTRLFLDGSVDGSYPVLTTNGFMSASFSSEFEDGDEITEKAADGSVCISWKADDTLKRLNFNLALCSPDPEAAALIAGGEVICAPADVVGPSGTVITKGEIVGYSSPPVGAVVGNPVAIELWSYANVGGKPAAGTPYWHWAFPYVKVRYEGDREFTNGALTNEFVGQALGNTALAETGLGGTGEDFNTYKCALVNPFSYVRSMELPPMGFSGPWAAGCVDCVELRATSATAGTPGSYAPAGADAPADFDDLEGTPTITASPTTAWTAGQYIRLRDATRAHWTGTAWAPGTAGA